MFADETPEEAYYTLHFLSDFYPPTRIAGLKRISLNDFEGKVFVSEWLIIKPEFAKIQNRLGEFGVKMMELRIYKPIPDQWCIVDWKLIKKAIEFGYAIAV